MSDFRTKERHAAKRRPQAEDFGRDAEPRPDATVDVELDAIVQRGHIEIVEAMRAMGWPW